MGILVAGPKAVLLKHQTAAELHPVGAQGVKRGGIGQLSGMAGAVKGIHQRSGD